MTGPVQYAVHCFRIRVCIAAFRQQGARNIFRKLDCRAYLVPRHYLVLHRQLSIVYGGDGVAVQMVAHDVVGGVRLGLSAVVSLEVKSVVFCCILFIGHGHGQGGGSLAVVVFRQVDVPRAVRCLRESKVGCLCVAGIGMECVEVGSFVVPVQLAGVVCRGIVSGQAVALRVAVADADARQREALLPRVTTQPHFHFGHGTQQVDAFGQRLPPAGLQSQLCGGHAPHGYGGCIAAALVGVAVGQIAEVGCFINVWAVGKHHDFVILSALQPRICQVDVSYEGVGACASGCFGGFLPQVLQGVGGVVAVGAVQHHLQVVDAVLIALPGLFVVVVAPCGFGGRGSPLHPQGECQLRRVGGQCRCVGAFVHDAATGGKQQAEGAEHAM